MKTIILHLFALILNGGAHIKQRVLFGLRVKAMVVSIMTILVVLVGCFGHIPDSRALNRLDKPELFTVAASSFIPVSPDDEWDEIHIIEEDEFGRTLFVYKMSYNNYKNPFSSELCWAFVCHKSSDNYAYYYDDAFISVSGENLSDTESNEIKSLNDWNKPIDEAHLAKTEITDNYNRYDNANEALVLEKFNSLPENVELAYSICADGKGNSLYLYVECEKISNENSVCKEFIVIKKADGTFVYDQIEQEKDYLDQIAEFKKSNGWDSSNCTVIFKQS